MVVAILETLLAWLALGLQLLREPQSISASTVAIGIF